MACKLLVGGDENPAEIIGALKLACGRLVEADFHHRGINDFRKFLRKMA